MLCAVAPWRCEAAQPLATEDADILGRADCEWEAQLSYGVGLSTQLVLACKHDRRFKRDFAWLALVATQRAFQIAVRELAGAGEHHSRYGGRLQNSMLSSSMSSCSSLAAAIHSFISGIAMICLQ